MTKVADNADNKYFFDLIHEQWQKYNIRQLIYAIWKKIQKQKKSATAPKFAVLL